MAIADGWWGSTPGGLATGRCMTFVFLDPPYGSDLAEPTLAGLLRGPRLAPGALVVVERAAAEPFLIAPGFAVLADRAWGRARAWFLRPI